MRSRIQGSHMAAAAAKLLQSCPTLCDPIDGSPSSSAVPGILQTRTLELVAISFSNTWKWKVKVKSLSPIQLFTTPWTAAYLAPLSMGFSRQEYWSGVPLPSLVSHGSQAEILRAPVKNLSSNLMQFTGINKRQGTRREAACCLSYWVHSLYYILGHHIDLLPCGEKKLLT